MEKKCQAQYFVIYIAAFHKTLNTAPGCILLCLSVFEFQSWFIFAYMLTSQNSHPLFKYVETEKSTALFWTSDTMWVQYITNLIYLLPPF